MPDPCDEFEPGDVVVHVSNGQRGRVRGFVTEGIWVVWDDKDGWLRDGYYRPEGLRHLDAVTKLGELLDD